MSATKEPLKPGASAGGKSEKAEDLTRRLLLYEVLLEEYETHCPLEKNEADSPEGESGPGSSGEADFEKVRQPKLSEEELEGIRKKGNEKKAQWEKTEPGAERERFEEDYNGELVAEFFTLLTKKQKEESKEKIKQLRETYDKKLPEMLPGLGGPYDSKPHDEMVGRLVDAHIFGTLYDHEENEKRSRAKTEKDQDEDGCARNEEEEKRLCEDAAFRAVLDSERAGSPPQPPGESEASDSGNRGGGGSNSGNGGGSNSGNGGGGESGNGGGGTSDSGHGGGGTSDSGHGGGGESGNGGGGESGHGSGGASDSGGSDSGHGGGKPGDPNSMARRAYGRSLRSALCLSGGGIRSATFNLGILQGLARHGLLDQFDYLSTVSGGGFIGGWLTAWMHREGTQRVVKELTRQPPSPVKPEPHPINHLRVFSNYLSPRPGLLSADTWTLIATLLRNLMLTWLVFVPFLVAALMVPRAWMAIVSPQMQPASTVHGWTLWILWMPLDWILWIGTIAGWFSLTFAGIDISKLHKTPANLNRYKNYDNRFQIACLLPGVISAAALSVYWMRVGDRGYSWVGFAKFSIWLIVIPLVFTVIFRLFKTSTDNLGTKLSKIVRRFILATLLITSVQVVVGSLLHALATNVFPHPAEHPRLYATFSVPLILSALMIGCALIAGLTSTLTKDEDMEWWSRAGAWFLIAMVGWAAMNLLVLFGPSIILLFGHAVRNLRESGPWDKESLKALGQVLVVVGGVVSGIITLLGGFSGKTSADDKETPTRGSAGRLLAWLTNILGPVFLGFLIILLALGTNWLLTSTVQIYGWILDQFKVPPSGRLFELDPTNHEAFVTHTPLGLILVASFLVLVVGFVMGLLINTNKFSLHFTWRDRIIRAYLGASRTNRNPQPFTNFDTNDNLYMCELRQQPHGIERPEVLTDTKALREECEAARRRKLFHVLNIALNLAGGDKLAWQDRKAESFTVSPLHAGSYWLGYRRSLAYGGDDGGISLGTAVAISGAFVSPNMGYMMTSPVVRFLMTLFNARFGWWLGNPGAAGDKPYLLELAVGAIHRWFGGQRQGKPFESASPALSVRPIVAEAFGKTNDKAPYVYLSDGGHFENLGLYEMVLRRCRFIVVCDASTDAGYSFDSLAQSIRQIRVDLGVPIDIPELSITTPSQDLRGKYCAVGRIRYSCVDRRVDDLAHAAHLHDEDFDGTLIYIKASMIGEEPRDVVNYGQGSQSFPQEIIVDQWFSEAQFESYRALGSHIIDVIASEDLDNIASQNQISLVAFERKALRHNQVNFRIFKERLSYDALASEFTRTMRRYAPAEYKSRVRRYLDNLLG